MKIAAILEDFNRVTGEEQEARRKKIMQLVREQTGAEYLIAVMSGDFLEDARPASADKYKRAGEAVKAGADMVLEIPVCAGVSDLSGKAFSGVAMLKRLYSVDEMVILCHDIEGEKIIGLAKFLFAPPPEYKKKLSQLLHGRPGSAEEFERAQIEALKACYLPDQDMGAGQSETNGMATGVSHTWLEQIFSDPVNRYALEIQMAMYQFYWIRKPVYVDIGNRYLPESFEVPKSSEVSESSAVPESSALPGEAFAAELHCLRRELASMKPEERKRRLLETPGGTPELYEKFLADQLETDSAEIRSFLLKLLIGMKRGDQIICGLRSNCPYGRVLALKDEASPGFLRVKEKSWVPLLLETASGCGEMADGRGESERQHPEARRQQQQREMQRKEQREEQRKALDECGQILVELDDRAHELYLRITQTEIGSNDIPAHQRHT